MEDWWSILLTDMLKQSEKDIMHLDAFVDEKDSWKDISLLMNAVDHYRFLRQAYENRGSGNVHVEVRFVTE